jgi:cysteine desulfurase/selenocysteine lyase
MDITKIRADFPILSREVYGKPLIYFDNGATTQKPRCVVDAIVDEYYSVNANVHRGVHFLSQQATELHEGSRETVRRFINARTSAEVIFTRGTTEAINLQAFSFGEEFMKEAMRSLFRPWNTTATLFPGNYWLRVKASVLRLFR